MINLNNLGVSLDPDFVANDATDRGDGDVIFGGIVGIRDTSGSIQAWGRAKKNNLENAVYKQECVCDDVFVDPQGRVWSCGCKTHQLGWVWQQDVLDGYDREFAHEGGRDPDLAIELEIESAADGDQSEVNDTPDCACDHLHIENETATERRAA